MVAPVEDEINVLVTTLNESEYTKEESLHIMREYVQCILSINVPFDQRRGASMTTMDFTKRVRKHDWKFAHGFFGHWAKSVMDEKDQDVGC